VAADRGVRDDIGCQERASEMKKDPLSEVPLVCYTDFTRWLGSVPCSRRYGLAFRVLLSAGKAGPCAPTCATLPGRSGIL
jgi:hypothetical protein